MQKAQRSLAPQVPNAAGLDNIRTGQDSRETAGPRRRSGPAGAPGARSAAMLGGLEDLLGDLWHARRSGDLGRLALVLYCEVRRWARLAGEQALAERSSILMTNSPHASREEFLAQVDGLIAELEAVHSRQS